MAWYPIGPDFVFGPRRSDFQRLSKRNEWSRQGLVNCIAIDQSDPNAIYVTVRPTSGGTSAFKTADGGRSWKPIADVLQRTSPAFDPNCIVVDPVDNTIIYMATWSTQELVRSDTQGDSWNPKQSIPGHTWKLLIDPTTAGTPASTVIYAATDSGVYRSPSGGDTGSWVQVLPGNIKALIAIFSGGTPVFYASVYGDGIYRSTNPIAAVNWTNLNNQGIGLPAHTAATAGQPEGNFTRIDLDFCPRNPSRLYAWLYRTQCDTMGAHCNAITSQLFTTSAADTSWSEIAMTSPPNPAYGFYAAVFGVAPNSAGDGTNDVLFFGNIGMNRSIDSGRHWVGDGPAPGAAWSHADHHAFAFYPPTPGAGVIATIFIGNDGGLGANTRFCDPAFAMNAAPEEYNEGATYLPNAAAIENLNHGVQSSAIYQYTGEPTVAALGYIGCQDTGIASSSGSLGWRAVADADGGAIAVARSTDGVVIWGNLGSPFSTSLWRDTGDYSFPWLGGAHLGAGGPGINASANFILGLDNNCLGGWRVLDPNTTLSAAITATGVQAVTPASMANIHSGDTLTIDDDGNRENVAVTATTATTFTANFTRTHAAGVNVYLNRSYVMRIDHTGLASAISQNFGTNSISVNLVGRSPVNANLLLAVTQSNRLWLTNAGSTADSTTVWNEVLTNRPGGGLPGITGIAVDNSDHIYVLFGSSVTTGTGTAAITSPLFRINGMTWEHQACTGLPAVDAFNYGNLLADPVDADVLYLSHGGSVFRLVNMSGTWSWSEMSTGLPGGVIYDLWMANFGSPGSPIVLLRAAIPTRGVWETSPALRNEMPATHLYMRDNILDQALLSPAPDGVVNPFRPSEFVYHYQSADIKVDVQRPGSGSSSAFFQINPEATLPLNHVYFNQLNDNSQQIPSGGSAYLHVQVHNRGRVRANNVNVWAIYCNAAAGVPALNDSAALGSFAFWSQFTSGGDILPNLPPDSPWTSVGPPVSLSGIEPASPQIASWLWTAPTLPDGVEGGHYCVAVFVHSLISPISETSFIVDEMTPRNKQVAQKNLHLVPVVPSSGSGGGGGGGGGGMGVPANYIEFHNPDREQTQVDLIFDLTRVPKEILARVQFSELKSTTALDKSATGVDRIVDMPPDKLVFPTHSGSGCLGTLFTILAKLFGKSTKARTINFTKYGFDIRGGSRAIFPGITTARPADVMARMYIQNTGELEPGTEYRFDVLQVVGKKLIGGCTYVIPVGGQRRPPENVFIPLQEGDEREQDEDDPHLFVPPHVKHLVKERRREMGKE